MATLRKKPTNDRTPELAGHLQAAERELRAAVVIGGLLNRKRTGQLVTALRNLQIMRLELSCETIKRNN